MASEKDDEREFAEFAARAFADYKRKQAAEGAKTVRELWDAFLVAMANHQREPHLRSATRYLALPCRLGDEEFVLLDLAWTALDHDHIEAWQKTVAKTPSRKGGRLLAPISQDAIRLGLQACFKYHVKVTKLMRSNPLLGIPKMERNPPRREGYFTPELLDRFLPHCRPLLASILRVSARCGGLRKDEVRTLTIDAIDREARELVVKNKGGGTKRVLIPDDVYEEIKALAKVSQAGQNEFLFPNPRGGGGPIPEGTLNDWFDRACAKSGILINGKKPCFHMVRHGFAMAMLTGGAPVAWISQQMGHKSPREVQERYGRLRGDEKERMREWMSASPLGALKTPKE